LTIEKPKKQKKHGLWKVVKISFWLLLLLVLLVVLLVFGTNLYLQSNKQKVFAEVSWLNQGSLSFDQAYISLFKDFPNASIVLKNVQLVDSMYAEHQRPLLVAEEVFAQMSLQEWRDQSLTLQDFTFKGGSFNWYRDSLGYSNLQSIFTQQEKREMASWAKDFQIKKEQIQIHLIDFSIHIADILKTRNIQSHVRDLKADLHFGENELHASVDLDLNLSQLILQQTTGSFLDNADLSGLLNIELHPDWIKIAPCQLQVNDQQFLFDGEIARSSEVTSVLNLKNTKTQLSSVAPLLPKKIQKVLRPYEIKGPFYSDTKIHLIPGVPAQVDVKFDLVQNDLIIRGIPFQKAQLAGRFINRSRFNSLSKRREKGTVRLELKNVQTQHGSFQLASEDLLITSNPIDKAQIQSTVRVVGPASSISQWYQNDKFFFEEGVFTLNADIQGPLQDINQLLLESTADLSLQDLSILYQPAEVSIPIQSLELIKKSGDAQFTILSTTLSKNYDYRMEGGLKNLAALLVSFSKESASSNVAFVAKKLSWEDFISVFSKPPLQKASLLKDERAIKQSMKKTIRGIYNKFQPSLSIAVDTFEYFDRMEFFDISTGVHFENENLLVLEQTHFDLAQGSVDLNARLDISHPNETNFAIELHAQNINLAEVLPAFDFFNIGLLAEYDDLPNDFNLDIQMTGVIDDVKGLLPNSSKGSIAFKSEYHDNIVGSVTFEPFQQSGISEEMQTQINLKGSPHLFNDFFKNDKFFFQDTGRFQAQFNYIGSVSSFDRLLDESKIDFTMVDAAVYYKDVDVVFPLDNVEVYLQQDTINYNLYMTSELLKRELLITGDINNVSELLIGNTGKVLSSKVKAYSPIINLDHAVQIFETPPDTSPIKEQQIDTKMKKLIGSLLNRFHPSIQVDLDTMIINDKIQLTDLTTGCQLKDSTLLILEQTDFNFGASKIGLNAILNLGLLNEEPFESHITTENLDLENALYSFDHFGINSLKNAEQVEGNITFDLDFSGSLVDLRLLEEKTKANLNFNLKNLKLQGIKEITKIAKKLKVRRFFHQLEFAPISNQVTVDGSKINIPQMEIQSTDLNLFVEGYVNDAKHTSIWLSIPIDNILRLGQETVPEKRGYAATKRKIFVEIFTRKNGKLRTKVRLRKKKFYKQGGNLEQYKLDKKAHRAIRKKVKLERKKNRKNLEN